ncbi:MAG: hypothetical protein CMM96_01970 [Rickettsiales bacterium]|nr:hypothetical protein [Rickettsiales bacterium]
MQLFSMRKISVAIVGSGISGLSCGWLLSKNCDVTIFEKNDYIGGHSNTVSINPKNCKDILSVDTGFIVFNKLNYPNLVRFLEHLNIKTYNSDMSFSVSLKQLGIEYGGQNIKTIFAQKKNITDPKFLLMLKDILRFFLFVRSDINIYFDISIDDYLNQKKYSEVFRNFFLYPMASSIWSTSYRDIKDYPFVKFVEFFDNHGLLNFFSRPQWKTVSGGSKEYINKILEQKRISTLLGEEVLSFSKTKNSLIVKTNKRVKSFDHLVFANHSDQVYKILNLSNMKEKKFFKMINFQKNIAYLHSDKNFLPNFKKIWSSWNYIREKESNKGIMLSYWMNNLQDLKTNIPIIVTLNPHKEPRRELTYKKIKYSHPVFNLETIEAQKKISKLNSKKENIWYCGAYLGNGFHEDGLVSGLKVAEKISNERRPWKT